MMSTKTGTLVDVPPPPTPSPPTARARSAELPHPRSPRLCNTHTSHADVLEQHADRPQPLERVPELSTGGTGGEGGREGMRGQGESLRECDDGSYGGGRGGGAGCAPNPSTCPPSWTW